MSIVLLDTCAVLALVRGDLHRDIVGRLSDTSGAALALVSPVTAWEIGMAASGKPKPDTLVFRSDPLAYFDAFMRLPFVRLTPLTPTAAIRAWQLPEFANRDPGDRLLVATARELGCPIVTSDTKILAYAALGHVQAVAC